MYSKLYDTFWGDLKRKGVSSEGKLLFAYLISCPHHNMTGLYYIPLAYISSDIGWDVETVSKGFAELLEKGFISYDKEAEMVLVRNYLKHNKLDNANVVKAAAATVLQLPESMLFQEFYELLERFGEPYALLRETVSERYGNTITIATAITKTITIPTATPSSGCAGAVDAGLGEVMTMYYDKINAAPSQRSLDELKGYVKRLSAEVCLKAIETAIDAGKAQWNYLHGILKRLETDNIRSLDDWARNDAERDKQKGALPQAHGARGQASFEELAKQLEGVAPG